MSGLEKCKRMLKDRKAKQRSAAAAAHAAAPAQVRTPEAVEPLPKKSPPLPKPARSPPPAPPAKITKKEIPPEIPALEAFIKKRIKMLCDKIAGPNPHKSHADVVECEQLIARLHPHYHDAALLLLERSREWSARVGLRSV